MKTITIRELHARTGRWVRDAARHGQILITDNGQNVARIVPEGPPQQVPYFARRKPSARFNRLDESARWSGGTDSTRIISEDREDRS